MTGSYTLYQLREANRPQVDDIAAVGGGDSDSSQGIVDLIRNHTNPARVEAAGGNYVTIAESVATSIKNLHDEAQRLAGSMGGEPLEGIFKKIGELQNDLAAVNHGAQTVGHPLVWYGRQVLPFFRDNVPQVGDVGMDDDIGDAFGSDGNAHALARHHLKQLNRFMGVVYDGIAPEMEQRAAPPQGGGVNPGPLPGLDGFGNGRLGGGVSDPYSGLGSPYSSLPGMNDPSLSGVGAQNPSIPGLDQPSTKTPDLQTPQTPDLQTPQTPDLKTPQTPDLKNPGDLKTPALPDTKANLAGFPDTMTPDLANRVNTGVPSTGPLTPSGIGTATTAAQGTGGLTGGGAGVRAGTGGMGMGMYPPGMGGANGQEQDRERTRFPMIEDEAFETDDLGGPAVIA
ncbi:hypothetical protein [Nonomuraea guangzhouensis]|uniref:WXG100 family type VII secretion target n=1 Tax=Nonomuraea guangzhouensis TaxID=1291555 RepID=A0ABW4GCR2_9ACTN|nr:hypothetical protein [Nonomuraea guangzhouensis]